MKIFHMGDWHIGKLVNGFYMTEDQEYVLNEVVKVIEAEKPDLLIIAGDLYDRAIPPIQAVELLDRILGKIILDLKIKVIAISGNHDSKERLEFGSSMLKSAGLYISGILKTKVEKVTLKDEFGNVNFYPIPFADVPVVRELYNDENIKTPNDAMKKIIGEINKDINLNERNIAIAHGYVTKMSNGKFDELEESESEKPISIGGSDFIDYSLFKDFHYTALGHLHGPQKVGVEKIRYSGSLMKYSFSEVNQKKGITIFEIDKEGNIEYKIHEIKPKRDFRVIEDYLENILKKYKSEIENREDYIKVVLKDDGEILDPMGKLRAIYPNIMELTRKTKAYENLDKNKVANIKEKSKQKLFNDFYINVMDEEASIEENEIIERTLELIEGREV